MCQQQNLCKFLAVTQTRHGLMSWQLYGAVPCRLFAHGSPEAASRGGEKRGQGSGIRAARRYVPVNDIIYARFWL
jgi:hypothetical protein